MRIAERVRYDVVSYIDRVAQSVETNMYMSIHQDLKISVESSVHDSIALVINMIEWPLVTERK